MPPQETRFLAFPPPSESRISQISRSLVAVTRNTEALTETTVAVVILKPKVEKK
jgi:hypothetical protein